MASPLYTPAGGYGTQVGNYYYVQTSPSGGQWSTVPQTPYTPMTYKPVSTGGGGGGGGGGQVLGIQTSGSSAPSGPNIPSYEDQMRSQIEGGYNSYFAELDAMMNNLPTQAESQKGIVQSQLAQGQTDLSGQQAIGMSDLARETQRVETAQGKSLKDVGTNIGNLMRAGNVYLGTRGAGDSSAADQMAFAYSKLGSQQRGGIMATTADSMNQIKDREFKLKTTYNTALNNLKSEAEQKTFQIAQWLAEQQNAIRQMKAQGQLQKGQDLATLTQNFLNIALQQANQVRTEAANKQAMLEQWALNNATTIQQAKANLGMITSGFQPPAASYTPQGFNVGNNAGGYTGNIASTGYGYSKEEKRRLGLA